MFRDYSVPSQDREQRQIEYFVRDVEAHIKAKERFSERNSQNRSYFEGQGGVLMSGIELPQGTLAIAKSVSPSSTYGFVQPVNFERGFRRTVLKEFTLSDILLFQPTYPDFWEKVAQDGVVQSVHLSQDVFDTKKTDPVVTIGIDEDVILPEIHVELLDDYNVQLLFSAPQSTSYLWPHCVAGDMFVFNDVPKELDRGFRVYHNACETRGMNLFDDVNPPLHVFYKHPDMGKKRLSIQYNLTHPNKMRPVEI